MMRRLSEAMPGTRVSSGFETSWQRRWPNRYRVLMGAAVFGYSEQRLRAEPPLSKAALSALARSLSGLWADTLIVAAQKTND
jgi:hypothetical protein